MGLFYVVHYDILERKNARGTSPATVNYANYIANVFANNFGDLEIISPVRPIKKGKYPSEKIRINDRITLKLFKSFHCKNFILKIIRKIFMDVSFFLYIFKKIKKNDIVIIGHLPYLSSITKYLFKYKGAKIIYQIGEIFGIVNGDPSLTKKEFKYFKYADAYILSNDKLSELVTNNKPYYIVYGAYQANLMSVNEFNGGIINCVYAGVLKPDKGIDIILNCLPYLPNNYHLHILGFGTTEEVNNVKTNIEKTKKILNCTVSYDGLLLGNEFTSLLSSCHIGLATQPTTNDYNDYAFPSKILTYFSNGLEVVSSKVSAVLNSKLSNNINFYEGDDPYELAKAIINVKFKEEKNNTLIQTLDKEFNRNILNILEVFYE